MVEAGRCRSGLAEQAAVPATDTPVEIDNDIAQIHVPSQDVLVEFALQVEGLGESVTVGRNWFNALLVSAK